MPVVREVNVRNTKCLRLACRGFIGAKQYRMYGIVVERRSAAYDQATPAELRISVVKPRPIQGRSHFRACSLREDEEISVLHAISHCKIAAFKN